jgi:hypothetical protein
MPPASGIAGFSPRRGEPFHVSSTAGRSAARVSLCPGSSPGCFDIRVRRSARGTGRAVAPIRSGLASRGLSPSTPCLASARGPAKSDAARPSRSRELAAGAEDGRPMDLPQEDSAVPDTSVAFVARPSGRRLDGTGRIAPRIVERAVPSASHAARSPTPLSRSEGRSASGPAPHAPHPHSAEAPRGPCPWPKTFSSSTSTSARRASR